MDPKDNKVRYDGSQSLTTPETPVGLSTKYFYCLFPESLSNCKSIKLGLVRTGIGDIHEYELVNYRSALETQHHDDQVRTS